MDIVGFATQGAGGIIKALRALVGAFQVEIIPFDRSRKFAMFLRILRRLYQVRPKLAVMEGSGVAGGVAILLARAWFGVRYVVSSGDAITPYISARYSWLAPVAWIYERLLCRFCDGYIGWSPYLVGRALTFGARRAMTAPGWVEQGWVGSSRDETRRKVRGDLGIPEAALVIGIAGSLHWNPRVRYAYGLELVESIRRCSRPDVVALVVGGGSGLERLRERAGDLAGKKIFNKSPAAGARHAANNDQGAAHMGMLDLYGGGKPKPRPGRAAATGSEQHPVRGLPMSPDGPALPRNSMRKDLLKVVLREVLPSQRHPADLGVRRHAAHHQSPARAGPARALPAAPLGPTPAAARTGPRAGVRAPLVLDDPLATEWLMGFRGSSRWKNRRLPGAAPSRFVDGPWIAGWATGRTGDPAGRHHRRAGRDPEPARGSTRRSRTTDGAARCRHEAACDGRRAFAATRPATSSLPPCRPAGTYRGVLFPAAAAAARSLAWHLGPARTRLRNRRPRRAHGALDLSAPGATLSAHTLRANGALPGSASGPGPPIGPPIATAPVPGALERTHRGRQAARAGWLRHLHACGALPRGRQLALSVPAERTAVRLYVNGQPGSLARATRARRADSARPAIGRRAVLTDPFACPLRIVVHVSNWSHRAGGISARRSPARSRSSARTYSSAWRWTPSCSGPTWC